ncbi:MAG: YdcF family protein [Kangiellaceae bacterium]|nr:YdcF family protein [Kangiellaceae bacterium]
MSKRLSQNLQTVAALSPLKVTQYANSQRVDVAIVVLAGGRISSSPEYGDIDTVSSKTLQRIQYAAWLHRKTRLPILVTGGSVYGESTAESVLMNQTMLSAFNIAPKWIEVNSKNTAENAKFSNEILKRNGITEILLVTHSNHMQRAVAEFERAELKIIPAPTVFQSTRTSWIDYFPSARALYESQQSLHEMVGKLWYYL